MSTFLLIYCLGVLISTIVFHLVINEEDYSVTRLIIMSLLFPLTIAYIYGYVEGYMEMEEQNESDTK